MHSRGSQNYRLHSVQHLCRVLTGTRMSDVINDLTVSGALQVAHVTGDVQFPSTKDGRVAMGWAAAQAATTADFSHDSWFWTHFSGGLNYQVCLSASRPFTILVAQTCKAAACCTIPVFLARPPSARQD